MIIREQAKLSFFFDPSDAVRYFEGRGAGESARQAGTPIPSRCEVEEYPEHSSTVDYYSFFIDRIVFFFLNVCIKYNKL